MSDDPAIDQKEDPKECFLINAGISKFSDIDNIDQLGDITILNLHCNNLSNLTGLPKFEYLTELNISSNEFRDANVSDLVHLSNLRILDMSGNYLTNLDNLPYLPSLEVFSVAFNNISSLNGLDGFPALLNLDVRGNALSSIEAFNTIQVLSSLRNIQLSSSDGRHSNPICGQHAEIITIFDSCFYLGTIDKKSRQDYANYLAEQKFGFPEPLEPHHHISNSHTGIRGGHVQVRTDLTPKFDKAAERFRDRLHDLRPMFDKAFERFRDQLPERIASVSPPRQQEESPRSGMIGGVEVFSDDSDQEWGELNVADVSISIPTSVSPVQSLSQPMPRNPNPNAANLQVEPASSATDPSNPWTLNRNITHQTSISNKVARLLQKTTIVLKKTNPVESVGIVHTTEEGGGDTSIISSAENISVPRELVVSSGDDDDNADTDPNTSKDYHAEFSQQVASERRNYLVARFLCDLLVVTSNNQARAKNVRQYFQVWKFHSHMRKNNETLRHCQKKCDELVATANSVKAAEATAEASDQMCQDLQKHLDAERARNSALQDRLIALEQAYTIQIQDHTAKQEQLASDLATQRSLTVATQDSLSQQEKKYSQSLQDITADVMQFTKIIESKDATIAALQSTKDKHELEINQLRDSIRDLTKARDQYVCPDCTKMKSFFETMQKDMHQLMERKIQLEHENVQVPLLTAQLADLKSKLIATQLDFTKQISEFQQSTHGQVPESSLTALRTKHVEDIQKKDLELEAKEKLLHDCLHKLTSAKEALMEYDDKCTEMEALLTEAQTKHDMQRDLASELERCRLDMKKNNIDMKKKDSLISEMKEHVLEVKSMLKKLADKCRSLEYVNETQRCDLIDAQTELKRLEDELVMANEHENERHERKGGVSGDILMSQTSRCSSESSDSKQVVVRAEKSPKGDAHGLKSQAKRTDDSVQIPQGDDVVPRGMFDELAAEFDCLQRDFDVQAERLTEVELQLHELEQEHDVQTEKKNKDEDVTFQLSANEMPMTAEELRKAYMDQKVEHEESLKEMSLSLRIKDKMIDDQNNAIRRLKERHRDDEGRVQETISILEEENDDIRNELNQLEEQLDQSRQQEKHCLKELRELEKERAQFQEKCKAEAKEEIRPYRVAIQEKDDALEKVRSELTSICEVVAEMKSRGGKKENEIKQLKKQLEDLRKENTIEATKYLKEKSAKDDLLKAVQKMRTEISQSLVNKENVIKDLKKSLKRKKIMLLESMEKISHMEQLFGTFQQLAATLSGPSSRTKHHQLSSKRHGEDSSAGPFHELLNRGALAHTLEKYSDANRLLKESISDMSVVSSDSSDVDLDDNEENEHHHNLQIKQSVMKSNPKVKKAKEPHRHKSPSHARQTDMQEARKHPKSASHSSSNPVREAPKAMTQSNSPLRSTISKTSKHLRENGGGVMQHLEEGHSSTWRVAGRGFTDVELSGTNSASILELSKSDDLFSALRVVEDRFNSENSSVEGSVAGGADGIDDAEGEDGGDGGGEDMYDDDFGGGIDEERRLSESGANNWPGDEGSERQPSFHDQFYEKFGTPES